MGFGSGGAFAKILDLYADPFPLTYGSIKSASESNENEKDVKLDSNVALLIRPLISTTG